MKISKIQSGPGFKPLSTILAEKLRTEAHQLKTADCTHRGYLVDYLVFKISFS